MEASLGHWTRDVLQQTNKDIPSLMRLNDRIHPPASSAVANIRLFLIILFDRGPQFFQFFRRRFFVALSCASKNRKDGVGRLGGAHHSVASSRPGDDESRIVSFPTHRVVPGAKRSADN